MRLYAVLKQKEGDSGLEFAEGSHRDIAVHAQKDGSSRDLSDRGYKIRSVGEGPARCFHRKKNCRHQKLPILTIIVVITRCFCQRQGASAEKLQVATVPPPDGHARLMRHLINVDG